MAWTLDPEELQRTRVLGIMELVGVMCQRVQANTD